MLPRSFIPATIFLFEQTGHPVPWLTLEFPETVHWWPDAHFHGNFLAVPAMNWLGSQPSACAASSGCVVPISLKPLNADFPAQYGHPEPLIRFDGVAK